MQLLSRSEISTIETTDQLQFILFRERGFLELAMPPIVLVVFLVTGIMKHQWWAVLFVGVGAFSLAAYWLNGPVTKLFVSNSGLRVSGNLHRTFTTEIWIPAEDLISLSYSSGDEDDPVGLYASRGSGSVCLLPNISDTDVEGIVGRIRTKFPFLEQVDTDGRTLLYGDDSGVTVLGLSGNPERTSRSSSEPS